MTWQTHQKAAVLGAANDGSYQAGGPRLFHLSIRDLCSRETAALNLQDHRRAQRATIICILIGQLSPVSVKKIRVVPVLDGYDKRGIAKDYLW
jgi:hypothetical protein